MKKNKKLILAFIVAILITSGLIGGYFIVNKDKNTSLINEISASSLNTSDDDIDWTSFKTYQVNLDSSLNITKAGVYEVTGAITNGNITVNVQDNVKLILSGVDITSKDSPAIVVESAKNCVIELKEGTTNKLTDSTKYSSKYSDYDGVISSKDDLFIQGTGSLEIVANHGDGIVSKDDLKINSGNYTITAVDDGIRVTDSVYIKDGSFNINSSGDGIKSTKENDQEKGYVYIQNGTFNITSELDGIQAVTKLVIEDGTFNIKTGGGSTNSSDKAGWGTWGNRSASTDTNSAKGLKADSSITIKGGKYTFDTSDDAIHTNDIVTIDNGTIEISSGDDGIHADNKLVINNGNIDISKSYEGLEAYEITINDGDIKVTSSDDGVNISNQKTTTTTNNNMQGRGGMDQDNGGLLEVIGGKIYVNAGGDGLDSNGSIKVSGGEVYVDGPTDNGNAALDYNGTFIADGGEVIAVGSSGMAQGISNNSKQNNLIIYLNSQSANTVVSIVDEDNNEILSYMPSKQYSSVAISTSKLKTNSTYRLLLNGNEYQSFTISSTTTTVGTNTNSMGGGPGGPGGGRRMR